MLGEKKLFIALYHFTGYKYTRTYIHSIYICFAFRDEGEEGGRDHVGDVLSIFSAKSPEISDFLFSFSFRGTIYDFTVSPLTCTESGGVGCLLLRVEAWYWAKLALEGRCSAACYRLSMPCVFATIAKCVRAMTPSLAVERPVSRALAVNTRREKCGTKVCEVLVVLPLAAGLNLHGKTRRLSVLVVAAGVVRVGGDGMS